MLRVDPSQWEDVIELGSNMAKECEEEVRASHDLYPTEATARCYNRSIESWTATEDGRVLGMSGLVPGSMLGEWASPWLLSTPELRKHPLFLIRSTKILLASWLEIYPALENYVDARYTAALKWAKASGFDIDEPLPYGPFQMSFHRISIRRT